MNKLRNLAATGAAIAAVGGGVEAAPAMASPVAHEAAATWTHLGGDPLFPGGVQTRNQFVRAITSAKGSKAMSLMGVSKAERAALKKAARQGKEYSCTTEFGEHFEQMSYGVNGVNVDHNVTFADRRYSDGTPAFCLDAIVKTAHGKEKIRMELTKKCGNISLKGREAIHTKVKKQKHPKALVDVKKIALTENGVIMPEPPTGTFAFEIKCRQNGKKIDRTVILNRNPQPLASCDIGKGKDGKPLTVSVTELPAISNEKWTLLSPKNPTQKQVVKLVKKPGASKSAARGNRFVYKNQEVPAEHPVTPVCPTGTTWVDRNGNGKVDTGECETPPVVTPKDGTQGAGSGTPGTTNTGSTVGGSGAGGNPGNIENGAPCYDSNSTTDGDLNPLTPVIETQPDILFGTQDQRTGYCIGEAKPMVQW